MPKSLYPYSSVNFKNLVPTCFDCNSTLVKGDKDIVLIANDGALFFPFDNNYSGLEVDCELLQNHTEIEKTEWKLNYISSQPVGNQIRAWKEIYNIETRHIGYVQGRLKVWLDSYLEFIQDSDIEELTPNLKRKAFIASLKSDKDEMPLKYAVLNKYLQVGGLHQAVEEAANFT